MADKVTKSLDDIIKENKSNRASGGGQRRGGPNRRGGSARGGASRGGGGGSRPGSGVPRRQNGGGAVQKRRSGGGNASLSPAKAAQINGKWSHDLYQNGTGVAHAVVAAGAGGASSKLVISNLDFGVNDSDIENLFQEFGRLKRASVHYDRSGRSLGTADVFYERRADAIRAMNHYNGVSLDGRPMKIELLGATPVAIMHASVPSVQSRVGGAGPNRGGQSHRRGGNNNAGGSGGGRGGARGGRTPKPVRTAADLDADLDAHNAKMQTE